MTACREKIQAAKARMGQRVYPMIWRGKRRMSIFPSKCLSLISILGGHAVREEPMLQLVLLAV